MIYSTLPVTEVNGSRTENKQFGVETSTVTLQCAFSDALAVMRDIVDNRRPDPLRSNRYATEANLTAINGDGSAYSVEGQGVIPETVNIAVTYSTPSPEKQDDPQNEEVLSESLESHNEFVTLNYKDFQWGKLAEVNDDKGVPIGSESPLKPEEAPGKLVISMTLNRNWKKIPGPLPIEMLVAPGCCNDAPYSSPILNLTFGAETLLYGGVNLSRSIRTDGIGAWDANMKFLFKPNGWNRYWRVTTQRYEMIFLKRTFVDPTDPTNYSLNPPEVYRSYPPINLAPLLGWV